MAIIEVNHDSSRQLQDIANKLQAANKIVVFTGAGISTNCGIPDFRSQGGLYSLIKSEYHSHLATRISTSTQTAEFVPNISSASKAGICRKPSSLPGNVKGRDLFDSSLWKDEASTRVFYKFIASLRRKIHEEVTETTATHKFLRTLRDQKKLVRCYTQNIDGLEAREGLCMELERGKGSRGRFLKKSMQTHRPTAVLPGNVLDGGCEVVQLHGDLDLLRCKLCQKTCVWGHGDMEASLLAGSAPDCGECAALDQSRRDRGKRGTAVGTLRPNIVLYGEEHPSADMLSAITNHDLGLAPDVLLILGTSLKVHGVKILVKEFAKCVHAKRGGKGKVIFVNLSKPAGSVWEGIIDYWVEMDCDEWVGDVRRRRPGLWQRQGELNVCVTKAVELSSKLRPSKSLNQSMNEDKENEIADEGLLKRSKKPRLLQSRPKTFTELSVNAPFTRDEQRSSFDKPETPSKARQLQTPPESRRNAPVGQVLDDPYRPFGEDHYESPCKRKKGLVKIWKDDYIVEDVISQSASDNKQQLGNISQWISFPKRLNSVEVPLPPNKTEIMRSSNSVGKKRKRTTA